MGLFYKPIYGLLPKRSISFAGMDKSWGGKAPGTARVPGQGPAAAMEHWGEGEELKIQCLFLVNLIPFGDHDQNFAILDMPFGRIVQARDVRVPLGNILIAFLHVIDPHGL